MYVSQRPSGERRGIKTDALGMRSRSRTVVSPMRKSPRLGSVAPLMLNMRTTMSRPFGATTPPTCAPGPARVRKRPVGREREDDASSGLDDGILDDGRRTAGDRQTARIERHHEHRAAILGTHEPFRLQETRTETGLLLPLNGPRGVQCHGGEAPFPETALPARKQRH